MWYSCNQAKSTVWPPLLTVYFILLMFAAMQEVSALNVFEYTLNRNEWPRKPTGKTVIQLPALYKIVGHFNETPEGQLSIRFPAGPNGEKWAKEVANWMTALGVPSSYIDLQPGSGNANQLILIYLIRNNVNLYK